MTGSSTAGGEAGGSGSSSRPVVATALGGYDNGPPAVYAEAVPIFADEPPPTAPRGSVSGGEGDGGGAPPLNRIVAEFAAAGFFCRGCGRRNNPKR